MKSEEPFWQSKKLAELTPEEWELLCDGCGYCCLVKLEDEDDNAVYTTNIACWLLDTETCKCSDYGNRQSKVETCLVLSVENLEQFDLLPDTCAYRCLYEGRHLPDWHPLVSQNKESVKQAGKSVCEYAISEDYIHPEQVQEHIIHRLR